MRYLPAIAVLCSPLAGAQTVQSLHTFTEPALAGDYGAVVHALSDVSGDGVSDIAVGSPSFNGNPGGVRIYSGQDGLLVHVVNPPGSGQGFGFSIAELGDVSGDGTTDFAIGGPGVEGVVPGVVHVHSGFGAVLYAVAAPFAGEFGYALAGVGDVNGDTIPDLAIGARVFGVGGGLGSGLVRVVSGVNGSTIYNVPGSTGEQFGSAITGLADVNGDGVPDWAASSPGISTVRVHSGSDGGLIQEFVGTPFTMFGKSIDGAGDIDGDGIEDVLIGAPAESAGPFANRGVARVYSTATGLEIRFFAGGFTNDWLGWSVAGGEDFDFDGVPDIVTGVPMFGSSAFIANGHVNVYSGADSSPLYNFSGTFQSGAAYGTSVDTLGDTNCNGHAEHIAGMPGLAMAEHVEVPLLGLTPLIGTNYCTSTANSSGFPSVISGAGSSCVSSNDLTLHAGPMAAFEPGLFYYGFGEVQLPFGNGFRCVGGSVFRLFPFGTADAGGELRYTVDMTNLPSGGGFGPGDEVKFQAWFRDPAGGGAGFDLSDGLSVVIQP